MKTSLEPGHSFFYAPKTLSVHHKHDPASAIAAVNAYVEYKLNVAQEDAVRKSFSQRVSLLWGPPGTGKTWTLAALIAAWMESAASANKPISILVGASNYNAIDNVLLQLAELLGGRPQGVAPVAIARVRSDSSETLGALGIKDLTRKEAKDECTAWIHPTQCVVVGGTYLQLLKLSRDINADKSVGAQFFDLLVLDEASQVSTASAMAYACLAKPESHFIVCGDHRQLGPVQQVKLDDSREGLLESVFAYLRMHHGIDPVSLSENYRSNEAITGWPSERFYPEGFVAVNKKRRLKIGVAPENIPSQWPASMAWSTTLEALLDPDEPVCVLTYVDRSSTVSNQFEANIAAALIRAYYLRLKAIDPELTTESFWADKAGLVTPHRAQIATIRNLLGADMMPTVTGMSFVDTVDRFQGQERDLIVASYTVSDPDFIAGEEAFILDPRRFNVTLTRAKSKFILLVSQTLLSHLPADLQVANEAAHMQLFTEHYCDPPVKVDLPYRTQSGDVEQRQCLKYNRLFKPDA